MQQHFLDRAYEQVTVYCVLGSLRNNVGRWDVRAIAPPRGARGFDFYSAKDKRMAADASCGLMLWDGESRGTLENVRALLSQEKPVAVYVSTLRRFVGLRSTADWSKLTTTLPAEAAESQGRLFADVDADARVPEA